MILRQDLLVANPFGVEDRGRWKDRRTPAAPAAHATSTRVREVSDVKHALLVNSPSKDATGKINEESCFHAGIIVEFNTQHYLLN